MLPRGSAHRVHKYLTSHEHHRDDRKISFVCFSAPVSARLSKPVAVRLSMGDADEIENMKISPVTRDGSVSGDVINALIMQ